ncbi:MAG TPA: hypothetical protein VGB13_08095 [Candidatus Krumholzibacteria bacterium]
MSSEYVWPLAVSLMLVVLTFSVAAYIRASHPSSYRGVWRYLGESAPAPPPVIAVSAAIAFALLVVMSAPLSVEYQWIPAAIAVGLFSLVLLIAGVAVLGARSILVAGPLAVVAGAGVALVPEARSSLTGAALGAIPLVLLAAYGFLRRGRSAG